jgi:Protein of unknown function (DUF732)
MPIKKLTSAVDTMAGPCEDETTTLDTTMADHRGLAWGADDDDEEPQRHPWGHTWELAATIIACTALLAGALIAWHVVLGHHRGDFQASALSVRVPHSVQWGAPGALTTVAPAVVPSVVTTVTQSPVTVTVTPATTPAPTTDAQGWPHPPVFTAAQDQVMLNYVRSQGVPVVNPARLIEGAHQYCLDLAAGYGRVEASSHASGLSRLDDTNTDKLTTATMMAYPGCW